MCTNIFYRPFAEGKCAFWKIYSTTTCGLVFLAIDALGFTLDFALLWGSLVTLFWPERGADIAAIAATLSAILSIFLVAARFALFAWIFPFEWVVSSVICFSRARICVVWLSTVWVRDSSFTGIPLRILFSSFCVVLGFFLVSGSEVNERSCIDLLRKLVSLEIFVGVIGGCAFAHCSRRSRNGKAKCWTFYHCFFVLV